MKSCIDWVEIQSDGLLAKNTEVCMVANSQQRLTKELVYFWDQLLVVSCNWLKLSLRAAF